MHDHGNVYFSYIKLGCVGPEVRTFQATDDYAAVLSSLTVTVRCVGPRIRITINLVETPLRQSYARIREISQAFVQLADYTPIQANSSMGKQFHCRIRRRYSNVKSQFQVCTKIV